MSRRTRWAIVAACLVAFVLRVIRLDEPVLRWDEGWSIAHATLPVPELLRIAAEDWHPPLYTLLLKAWLWAGKSVYHVRYLSVLLGVIGVPLAALVGWRWSGRGSVAWLSAGFAAAWPLLVYYGQVTRMYPLVVAAVLLAAYGMLRVTQSDRVMDRAMLAVGTAGAMWSLYYAVWPLLGVYLWGLASGRSRLRGVAIAGLMALLLYLPWLPAGAAAILFRTTGEGPGPGPLEYLGPTLDGLAFTFGTSRLAMVALGVTLMVGFASVRWNRTDLIRLALPALAIALGVAGMLLGAARSHWFAIRHLAPVAPFLGLGLAWALDRAARRHLAIAVVLVASLAWSYWPTSTEFVYAKTLEVVDSFDPTSDYRYLEDRTRAGDLVFFNVLSTAGWYEQLRRPSDPHWSHVLRWDPIVEPIERVVDAQLDPAIETRERLWFVLYKGDFGTNRPLVDHLEQSLALFPADGAWREDTWYRLFVAPKTPFLERRIDQSIGPYRLTGARLSHTASPGGVIGVELGWTLDGVGGDHKVYVHVLDASGRLVAQHDGFPAADRRPASTWTRDDVVADRHGIALPDDAAFPLTVRVGLYDPRTSERLKLPDGADHVILGRVDRE